MNFSVFNLFMYFERIYRLKPRFGQASLGHPVCLFFWYFICAFDVILMFYDEREQGDFNRYRPLRLYFYDSPIYSSRTLFLAFTVRNLSYFQSVTVVTKMRAVRGAEYLFSAGFLNIFKSSCFFASRTCFFLHFERKKRKRCVLRKATGCC